MIGHRVDVRVPSSGRSARHDANRGLPPHSPGAHQKLALAHRGAGDLSSALRHIDVALANRSAESPIQSVRLDTAHAHILLSDPVTAEDGRAILGRAARLSTEYGLSHQLRSIEGIRCDFERQAPNQGASTL